MKSLSELTDRELDKAIGRMRQRLYKHEVEQSRRKLISRYGSADPELNTYSVWVSLESCALDVSARSEEEAIELVTDELCVDYGNVAQIAAIDGPSISIDEMKLMTELEVAAD